MKFHSSSVKALCSRVTGFLIILGLSASISGCQWGDEIVSLVQPNPDEFAVYYIDSSSVSLSTIAFDSLETGGAARLLLGRYKDAYFGKVHTVPYMQPSLAAAVTIDDKTEYDSIIVSLRYDKYFYGDTTKWVNVKVHALQSNMTDGVRKTFFNTSKISYDAIPLGSKTFYPRPVSDTTINIRLSDVFGKKVFAMAKNNQLNTGEEWINVLNGIAIVPDASYDGAVVGLELAGSSVELHYHTVGFDASTKASTVFKVNAGFGQIISDKTGTPLTKLQSTYRLSTPSSETGNVSYIQSGIGLATKVMFPTVREMRYNKRSIVNRAFLKVYPANQSVSNYLAAPKTLYMYRVDKNNNYYLSSSGAQPLTSLAGGAVTADLKTDYILNEQYYLFDVSSYVLNAVLSDSELEDGIVILPYALKGSSADGVFYPELGSDYAKSVTRLAIGDQKSSSKHPQLQVYYTFVTVDGK